MFQENEASVNDDPAVRRNGTILVVDDNRENRSILERFLLHLGYQVDLCQNGREALEKSREKVYEIIFSDVNMPVMTGIEFLQTLRQKRDETPVVMVTGFPSITLAVDSMKKGATDFVPKPFRLEHIEHVVLRIEKEKALQRQNHRLSEQLREKTKIEKLNQELRTTVAELSLLYSTSEMAHDIQDMEVLFDRMVEMTSTITRGNEISILLFDRETRQLIPKRVRGNTGLTPIPVEEGIAGTAVMEKQVMVVPPGPRYEALIPHSTKGTFLSIPMMIKNEVFGVLNISKASPGENFTEKEIQLLQNMIAKCTLSLENHALYEGFYENIVDTLGSLVMAVEAKDLYTRNHSRRVTDLAIVIANEMKCSRAEMETLRFAGLIHDIGKIGIQDMVLLKPGRLDHEEWEIIRTHPVIGENIVQPLTFLKEEQLIVRHHHEHFDGRGYPDGLCADEIPHLARIIALADAYDAITSSRPYRTARGHDFALSEIERARNTQFDPDVTDAFFACLDVYGPENKTGGIPWERIGGRVKSLFSS